MKHTATNVTSKGWRDLFCNIEATRIEHAHPIVPTIGLKKLAVLVRVGEYQEHDDSVKSNRLLSVFKDVRL